MNQIKFKNLINRLLKTMENLLRNNIYKLLLLSISLIFLLSQCLEAKKSAIDISKSSSVPGFGFLYLVLSSSTSSSFSVVSTTPIADSTDASIANPITVIFNNTIDKNTVTQTSVLLVESATNSNQSLTFSVSEKTLTVSTGILTTNSKYTLTIKSGDTGIKDISGNKLVSDYILNFTTAAIQNLSGASGLNFNAGINAKLPDLVQYNTKLFAFWSEINAGYFQLKGKEIDILTNNHSIALNKSGGTNDEINLYPFLFESNLYLYNRTSNVNQFSKYNSNSNWTGTTNLVTCSSAFEYKVISQGSTLYLIQDESGCYTNRVVRVYTSTNNGTSWSSIVGSNNYDRINGSDVSSSNYPDIIYFNNQLYATYVSGCTSACSVKFVKYSGTGSTWGTATTISDVTSNIPTLLPHYSKMFIFNNKLYITYSETINTAIRVRVKVFNGDPVSPNWTAVDNLTGLNSDLTKDATRQVAYIFNSKIFIIWSEINSSGISIIRMKVYNGNDSSPTWTSVDGGGVGGFNVDSNKGAYDPKIIEFSGKLYGIWSESDGTSKIYLVRLPL